MFSADRMDRWNSWYDGVPEIWRFQFVLWPLLLIGAINMALTISIGFPFGLLVLLAILFIAAIRIPRTFKPAHAPALHGEVSQIRGAYWIHDLNARYESMPEWKRFWVIPTILIVVGAINMALTIGASFPFGLLFLVALLAVIAIRAPYAHGLMAEKAVPASMISSPMHGGTMIDHAPGVPPVGVVHEPPHEATVEAISKAHEGDGYPPSTA